MEEDSRVVAAQILRNVLEYKEELGVAISKNSKYKSLQNNDKNFSMLLVNEVFRHMGQMDIIINKFLDKPQRLHIDIRMILRVATAEKFFTNSPDYAIVNNAVNATKAFKKIKLKGLVNAVTRKICALDKEEINNIDIENNFPQWLVEIWNKQYGKDKTKQIMEGALKRYPLYVNVKSDPEKWEKELNAKIVLPPNYPTLVEGSKVAKQSFGGGLNVDNLSGDSVNPTPHQNSDGVLTPPQGGSIRGGYLLKCNESINVTKSPGFAEGEWWVQGFESSLPARLLGDLKDKVVLDCCAAPGGKTIQLVLAGARVVAIEKSNSRIVKLEENADRLKLGFTIENADATTYNKEKDCDAILIDAPCSATGTIRKNPDVLYNKTQQQIKELVKVQKAILENMAKLLKVNGTMIYATCSLQKEEGEDQINNFLKEHGDFELSPITAEELFGFKELINKDGMVRIIPQEINEEISSDGFFIARLRKVKNERDRD